MPYVLNGLSESDLIALERSLRSGRMVFPPSKQELVALGFPESQIPLIQTELTKWGDARTASLVIEGYCRGKGSVLDPNKTIQLVYSGPDCEGTYPRDTKVVVDGLFRSANTEVLIAGYAIHNGREVFDDLAQRMDKVPELRVKMFLHIHAKPDQSEADTISQFARTFKEIHWSGNRLPEIYYDPRTLARDPVVRASLHAKFVVCDRRVAFITSANFTEAAQSKNIEVGVVVRSPSICTELGRLFDILVGSGILKNLQGFQNG